jgi:aminoglycoside/choline kinase family phosphotransferase
VASLLCDAYVDLGDPEVDRLFEHYVGTLPGTSDTASFRERFDIVAAQRMIKALGTFGYQLTVMGRERYRSAIPRTIARLSRRLPQSGKTRPLADTLSSEGILNS